MNTIKIIKAGASFVVSVGAGMIVSNVVKCTTPAATKAIMKICVAIGGFALSNLVGSAASDHTEKEIDKFVDTIKNATTDTNEGV